MAVKPRLATIPAALKVRCAVPVNLPERDLDSVETVELWARDRAALGECGLRHKALVGAAEAIERQVHGGE